MTTFPCDTGYVQCSRHLRGAIDAIVTRAAPASLQVGVCIYALPALTRHGAARFPDGAQTGVSSSGSGGLRDARYAFLSLRIDALPAACHVTICALEAAGAVGGYEVRRWIRTSRELCCVSLKVRRFHIKWKWTDHLSSFEISDVVYALTRSFQPLSTVAYGSSASDIGIFRRCARQYATCDVVIGGLCEGPVLDATAVTPANQTSGENLPTIQHFLAES